MATNTYVALDKVTVGTATSSITFSSIPSTYTDLVLVVNEFNATATNTSFQFQVGNGSIDTGTNYSLTELYGTGSAAGSDRASSDTAAYFNGPGIGTSTTTPNVYVVNFMNYSNTTTYKTFLGRGGSADKNTVATVNLWRSTSAINTIKVFQSINNIAAGSTFSLYGIAAAAAPTAKATGGTITYDVGYTYHTFTSSGTFTPSQALAIDTLVIAGGGAGGYQIGGGGGAGGVVYTSGSNVTTSTAYTVTVGAGGAQTTSGSTRNSGSDSNVTGTGLSLTAAVGGGGGGAFATPRAGLTGGSGGGGASIGYGAAGTSGQGSAGGDGYQSGTRFTGGGGGGFSAAGGTASTDAGTGGNGSSAYSSWGSATSTGQNISGIYYYAGGGGGGNFLDSTSSNAGTGRAGGNGGGGSGGRGNNTTSQVLPTAGTANTGGGGGGSGAYGFATQDGYAGGSGIVIIRYAN